MANPVTCPVSRSLVCHPQTPPGHVNAIGVQVESAANGILVLTYVMQGNLTELRIPAERPSLHVHELWRHTCFEAFLMIGDGPGYREYNFSPSCEWAAYTFRDYRQPTDQRADIAVDEPAPVILVHRDARHLTLQARLPLKLPRSHPPYRLGLSTVVETVDGGMSYWALRHPPGKPDFHHVDAFALQLAMA